MIKLVFIRIIQYYFIFKDSFWWIENEYLKVNKKNLKQKQNLMKNRLSKNYIILISRNYKIKGRDKLFQAYNHALAEIIWRSLHHAYPNKSQIIESNEFKLQVIDICALWTTGIRPSIISNLDQWPIQSKHSTKLSRNDIKVKG